MAKEAGIKLTLKSSGFTSGLREVEQQTAAAGKRMGGGLKSALGDGLKGGATALKGAMSGLKSTVMSVGSLGGAIGGVAGTLALVQGAMKAESSYKNLAFQIKAGGGALVDWRDLQKDAQAQALSTGIAVEDIAASMGAVRDATGDTDFMRASIGAIATTARATGKPIGELASIAGGLGEKFGVTAKELPDALADVVSLAAKGGVTFEEMAGGIDAIGSVAKSAGLEGRKGFGDLIAILGVADKEGKNLRKNLSQVGGVLAKVGTKGAANDTFKKLGMTGVKATGDMQANLAAVLKFTGGDKDKLTKGGFSEEQTSFLMELDRSSKAAGGLQTALAAAGKSSMTFAGIEAQAASRMKGAQAQMDQAMEKLKVAFSNPAFIDGLASLMGRLPAAVDNIIKVVEFAADTPVAAAGLGAAAYAGQAAVGAGLSSLLTSAFASGGAGAAAKVGAGLAEGGASAAAAIEGSGDSFGKKAGATMAAAYFVGLAVEQGQKLSKEWDGNSRTQMSAKFRHDLGIDNDEEFAANMRHRSGMKTGHAEFGDSDTNRTEFGRGARRKLGMSDYSKPDVPAELPAPGGFIGPPTADPAGAGPRAPAAPQRSAADAALLREMMGVGNKLGGVLEVRITNPEAIGKSGPVPGPAKRP